MSRIAPTAMLFIPCRGGVSHRPDEYASPEAIARGVLVLAHGAGPVGGLIQSAPLATCVKIRNIAFSAISRHLRPLSHEYIHPYPRPGIS